MPRATERGEIWQAKVDKNRRVIILSRDDLRGVRTRTTVVTVTSTIRGTSNEVPVDHRDGFDQLCVINCDDVATVRKDLLVRRIGRLSRAKIEELDHALQFALGLR
jgi:mRNA interferase MazF